MLDILKPYYSVCGYRDPSDCGWRVFYVVSVCFTVVVVYNECCHNRSF